MATSPKKQLVIIGAGPAGYTAAFLAADQGLSVTLIDQDPLLGGTCLHRGCIPSKTLLSIVQTMDKAKRSRDCGVHFQDPQINLDEIRTFKKNVVAKLSAGLTQLCKQKKISFIQGATHFINSNTISIERPDGTKEDLEFQKCIIATGSSAASLPLSLPASPLIMSSAEALELKDIPETLLIVGGGYIGLEMATIYAGFGSKITICEAMDSLLAGVDQDLVSVFLRTLKKKTNDIRLETKVTALDIASDAVTVTFNHQGVKSQQNFQRVLIATGRKPNLSSLNLKNTKVQILANGFIATKNGQQTHDKNIYAIGDVVEGPMLAHKAAYQATIAIDAIVHKRIAKGDSYIPAVVFTDPEIAYCGLTEKEAQRKNIKTKIIKFPWSASGRAVSISRTDGLTKFILDAKGKRLLGAGIVGPEAGELIAQAILLMQANIPLSRIAASVFPHPTLSETFKECLDLSLGRSFYNFKGEQAAR